MRKINLAGGLFLLALSACNKMTTNPYYASGTTPVLTVSSATIAPTPADSLNNAVVFSWTDPKYPTPAPAGGDLYTLQIDSAGHNFAAPIIITGATLNDSLTAKQLNTMILGMGGAFGVTFTIEIRVISSYSNNNDQLASNTLTVQYTPYKTPPKVVPPTGPLYLVGSASQGGWTAPVPVPAQVFEEVDSVDYAGVFNLTAGGQFLVLPQNTGSYNNKIATSDANETGTGGTFGYNDANNFTGPAAAGWYTIWLNFQTATISITPFSGVVPNSLFIVGSATNGGWTSPVPVPSQALTQTTSSQFSLTLPFTAAGQYLLLPTNSSTANNFTDKYAVGSANNGASAGTFGYNPNGANAAFNNNFNGPAAAGTYTLTVDFLTWTYTVK